MTEDYKTADAALDEDWTLRHTVDSRFRLIVVSALRSKQLLHGARPHIEADPKRQRNTSIALEEVRRGLVPFTLTDEGRNENGGGHSEHVGRDGF
jgi:DNA-directed RNA polymerase omega subunit